MTNSTFFANHLLIAMPGVVSPEFNKSVIYLCEHNAYGAVGLIVNQPMHFPLKLVFDQLQIEPKQQERNLSPLLFGGPVQPERGFVIHRPKGVWRSSLALADDVTVTTSSDIIKAIADDIGPNDALIALGYAGWSEGQLEAEILTNSWLLCPYRSEILYEVPFEDRWDYAASTIGVKMTQLFSGFGHA